MSRFFAAFAAAWFSLQLLNTAQKPTANKTGLVIQEKVASGSTGALKPPETSEYQTPRNQAVSLAGKSMDLTLFAVTRAVDTVVGYLWFRHKSSRLATEKWTYLESSISHLTDAGIFAISAGTVMWAWFYLPERLPRAYNKWIEEAAQVDKRLVEALRRARRGEFVYGVDTGQAPLLQSMCEEYGWPTVWGDPSKTVPIPCEMVHMGIGPSCTKHVAVRFARTFKFALATYLPLQLLVKARKPSAGAFQRALTDAVRSSAFLGAFVALFYGSVCMSRTRLGPRVFSPDIISPMMWDSGLCVGAGCMFCGWSILIEAEKRRQEVAFFVAPRAAATLMPRRYNSKYFWRENLAFSVSTAVVFAFVQENPARVRGVLGQLLNKVLE